MSKSSSTSSRSVICGYAKAARLGAAATAVSLPADLIDDLIAGGRAATAWNDALIALTK
jgi:hypothetical protein